MKNIFIKIAILFAVSSIILGAFGAHGLKDILSPVQLNSFLTGIRYQMYHALLLFYIASTNRLTNKQQSLLLKLILVGVLLFSGSIYLLATNDLTTFEFKVIGFLTPLGGLFLICAWTILFVYNLRNKS